ncbi:LysE family translocator [Thalassobacillus pellis]|uniref:LysE family translocator n=1 Tax=Thalassobacillus pellis TaxID=748008 RepID=UPI0019619CDE|nr:LysE family translocator [Thalassobacillus pellis]MBM7554517.1 threonine/homoserine/homoserine lactone efflux protein [Thalassobacillus pellis]
MEVTSVLAFLGVAVILTLMPGPDNLFVMVQSMSQDRKAGIATSFGLCTGLIVHITAATVGLSAVVYQSAFVFALVKYAGALYLLFLAWQSFREKADVGIEGTQQPRQYKALYQKGIVMNLLNPKVSVFFLALLPQFVTPSGMAVSLQMLLLGMLFLGQALVIFTLISVFSEKVRVLFLRHPWIAQKMNVLKGSMFIIIGLQMALRQK